jgi:hypothetical protein
MRIICLDYLDKKTKQKFLLVSLSIEDQFRRSIRYTFSSIRFWQKSKRFETIRLDSPAWYMLANNSSDLIEFSYVNILQSTVLAAFKRMDQVLIRLLVEKMKRRAHT